MPSIGLDHSMQADRPRLRQIYSTALKAFSDHIYRHMKISHKLLSFNRPREERFAVIQGALALATILKSDCYRLRQYRRDPF